MKFLTAAYTDIGTRKKTNQDSMLVMQAETDLGPVLLAAVCDGMGGLAKGEVASAVMVKALRDWFAGRFPVFLSKGFDPEQLRNDWYQLVAQVGQTILDQASKLRIEMGTTAVVMLAVENSVYTMNVGDSRIYLISDNIYQLTKDQTFVQREMDQGRLSAEEAAVHPQKNVLLQCIGASRVVEPDFGYAELAPNQVYLLCSDGFRHVIQPSEFYQKMNPSVLSSSEDMRRVCREFTDLNISRGENDNISSILIKAVV